MSDKNEGRVKVTGITMNLLYPDGHSRTVTLDPRRIEAIFFTERGVKEIYAPFYEKYSSEFPRDEFIQTFGKKGEEIIGKKKSLKMSKDVLSKLWETKDPDGSLPGIIIKTLDCKPW